jgi:hypothetical protein
MRPICITDFIDCMHFGGAGKLACGTKNPLQFCQEIATDPV